MTLVKANKDLEDADWDSIKKQAMEKMETLISERIKVLREYSDATPHISLFITLPIQEALPYFETAVLGDTDPEEKKKRRKKK